MTESPGPIVRVSNVVRTYRVGGADVHALRGVDLAVERGEFLGVVGVSGSGKSTLLHLIGGLDSPDAGEVVVAGATLGQMSRRERAAFRRSVVGFVFQQFFLVPTLTAAGNLGLALTLQGVYGAKREALVVQALERVGLADRAAHRPGQLSVGQQQRVAVARALAGEPQLLLADEPTANLDRATAIQLMDLLRGLNRQLGTTVVMVTHDEPLAREYCSRIVTMVDGQLNSPAEGPR